MEKPRGAVLISATRSVVDANTPVQPGISALSAIRPDPDRCVGRTAGVGPFVGRAVELDRHRHDLDRLLTGRGGATAYGGEPGIGKTRLLAVLRDAARCSGITVVTGRPPDDALAEARRSSRTAVFIDDLHLASADAAGSLSRLVDLAGTRPVLLVVAYRPRQVDPAIGSALSAAEASTALRHFVLGPLAFVDTRRLLPGRHDAARVHADGGGNPLYMTLLAGVAPEPSGGLLGQLAALGGPELRTARAAAVLGRPFTVDLLTEICGPAAVEALVDADVLRPDGPLLAFRHPVLADVVYRHTPIGERWTLHRRAEEALTRRGAAATDRARHIAAAGLSTSTHVDALLSAATQNLVTDPASARRWAGAAGALMPDGDPRRAAARALAARSGLLVGEVTGSREALLAGSGGPTDDTVFAGRALTLLGQYDEASALLRANLPATADSRDTPAAASLLSDLANVLSDDSDFETASRLAQAAAGIARRHGDRLREAAALAEQAWARGCADDVAAARTAAGAAAALVDAMADATLAGDLRCLYQLSLAEVVLEQLTDAHRHLTRGVRLSRRTGQRYLLAALLQVLGEVRLRLGQVAAAVETLDEAVHEAGRDDLVPQLFVATGVRGLARYWRGDDDARVLADAETIEERCAGRRWSWAVLSRCLAAELMASAGHPDRGGRLLLLLGGGPELRRLTTRRRVRAWESLTTAALALGDHDAATRYAGLAARHPTVAVSAVRRGMARRAAIRVRGGAAADLVTSARAAIADFADADHWLDVGWTQATAAQAAVAAGRPELAASFLGDADERAAATGSGRLAGLVAAARRRAGRPFWASGLTAREFDVADLAVAGLTSAQIGERLFLSVRTVDTHLGRVYRKLGVSNRMALARLAVDRGQPCNGPPK
ncbi:helix-turn-helix transcriptional regulator [Virgisporangium ochraceum]|uniref:LuxR family transcriptional regulator n=1 Tax=Virgisporangium ochraceum TaxID=65505 RepID=A0A8J4EE49_9ACTN|nr:LuxR family transcriptional regulator [Virgisporangium ochraceum]GIJ71351.1 LuxR family transcriptional regulator [Virgisporangium ochraceum]